MNKYLLLATILITLLTLNSYASHIMGGSVCYEFIQYNSINNTYTYRIKMEVYRDQGGINVTVPFNISVYNNNAPNYTLETTMQVTMVAKDTIYPSDFTGPNCNLALLFPTTTEVFHMEGTVDLPPSLLGYYIMWTTCCRNGAITNVNQGSSTHWAFIPATFYNNNSPCYVDQPVLFTCKGVPWTISNRAVDPDGDLLFYHLITPFAGNATPPVTDTVTYQNVWYNGQNPFGMTSSITVNSSSGVTTINADSLGIFVMAVEVQEFRNGFLLSQTVRDIQISVENCAGENPAVLDPDSLPPGITYNGGFNIILNITEGDSVCLKMPFFDPDGDKVDVNYSGGVFSAVPPATLSVTPIDSPTNSQIMTEFCWTTDCGQARPVPYVGNIDVENTGGCPPSTTPYKVIVYVNPYQLVPGIIIGPDTVCANEKGIQFIVIDSATDYNYDWYVTGGTVALSNKDTAYIDWGFSSNQGIVSVVRWEDCHNDTLTFNVTILPAPVAVVNPTWDVCVGDSVRLDASFSVGNTFTWTPNYNISNVNSDEPWVWPDSSLTYTLVVSSGGACDPDTADILVIVHDYPTLATSNDTTICFGETVGLQATSDPTYLYSWTPTSSLSNANVFNPDATPVLTTDYIVTVTSPIGCVTIDTVRVTVTSPYVDVGPANPVSICLGDTFYPNVTAVAPQTILWTPSTGLSSTSVLNPDMFPIVTTDYIINVTDTNGCQDSDTLTVIVVNTSVIAVIMPLNPSLCDGDDSLMLVASGGTQFQWTPAPGLTQTNIFNPMVLPSSTQDYTVIVSSGTCNPDTATVTVSVYGNPIVDAGPADTGRCLGDPPLQLFATVTGAGQAPYSYTWSPPTGLSATNIANPQVNNTTPKKYYVEVEDLNGCKSIDSITVFVSNVDLVLTSTPGDISYCGDPITIITNVTGSAPYTYVWFPNSSTTTATATVGPMSMTTYNVLVTDALGCIDNASITINANLSVPVEVVQDNFRLCAGEGPITFEAFVTNPNIVADSFRWDPIVDLSSPLIAITDATPTQSRTYTVTAHYNTCIGMANIDVVVVPLPKLVIAGDTIICVNEEFKLIAAGDGGLTYDWDPTGESTQFILVDESTSGIYTYTVTGVNDDGCVNTSTHNMHVIGLPTIDILAFPGAKIDENHIASIFAGTGQPGVTLTSTIVADAFIWTPDIELDDPTLMSPYARPILTTTYTVTATNEPGCVSIDTVRVEVVPLSDIQAPTAFIPGSSDLENRRFTIHIEGFENPEVRVYNRWGEVVWIANNLDDINDGWDGTYKGQDQPTGTYIWYLSNGQTYDENVDKRFGTFTLIR